MDYIHFLDNNIFRALCTSPNGEAIRNLHNSISNIPFLESSKNIAFKLTPFSILEEIGIKPPKMFKISTAEITLLENALNIAEYLTSKAKKFYMESEIISLEQINKKAVEQEKYVTPEAKNFYCELVKERVNEEGFIDYLYNQLVMDYLMKYDYGVELEEIMLPFFNFQFFMDDNFANYVSNDISKFRLAKKVWNKYYNNNQHGKDLLITTLDSFNEAMDIDKHADYLDCELIHFCCLGAFYNQKRSPVIGYTTDDPGYIIPRINIYNKYLDYIRISFKQSNPDELYLPAMNNMAGSFAFCTKEGIIYKVIDINRMVEIILHRVNSSTT
jgi:hypothetical protein